MLLFLLHLLFEHLLEPVLFLAHEHILHLLQFVMLICILLIMLLINIVVNYNYLLGRPPLMLIHLHLFSLLSLLKQGLSSYPCLGLSKHLSQVNHQGIGALDIFRVVDCC